MKTSSPREAVMVDGRGILRSTAQKVLATALSVVLVVGLAPTVPAWGDETDQAANSVADTSAETAPEANASAAEEAVAAPAMPAAETAADGTESPTADTATEGTPGATATDTPAGTENTPAGTENTPAGGDATTGTTPDPSYHVDQCFPANDKDTAALLKNLTKRFEEGGADSKMDDSLVNAAIALNSLGDGLKIDVASIEKKMVAAEKKAKDGLTAGQYGRYIMMLTAGGIDCIEASINGKTRDLVAEMEKAAEKAIKKSKLTVEDAVYMLPVYGNDGYTAGNDDIEGKLLEVIMAAQGEGGFFWTSDKAETYSIPLTGQALLALLPYTEADETIAGSTALATQALYDSQMIEGGWAKDGIDQKGDVVATALATAALAAAGAVPNTNLVTSAGSTPIGWLTAQADKDKDGFTGIEKKDAVTAAAVLMALAANEGATQEKGAYDVYDAYDVDRPATKTSGSKAKKSTTVARTAPATKTIPQSGDESPVTGLIVVALMAAGALGTAFPRRKTTE